MFLYERREEVMGERCKLCNRILDPMEGRLLMPDFYYRSRHLRNKHNLDTSKENVSDYFEIVKWRWWHCYQWVNDLTNVFVAAITAFLEQLFIWQAKTNKAKQSMLNRTVRHTSIRQSSSTKVPKWWKMGFWTCWVTQTYRWVMSWNFWNACSKHSPSGVNL